MKRYILVLFCCSVVLLNFELNAQVARLVHYRGELINSEGTKFSGTINLQFNIYKSPLAEEPVWSETHANVQVTDGIYDVLLGGQNPLKLSFYEYFIEVKADSFAIDQPRKMIVGSGYNYRLGFLFSAYTIVWLAIFFYMLSISKRQKKLIRELEIISQARSE